MKRRIATPRMRADFARLCRRVSAAAVTPKVEAEPDYPGATIRQQLFIKLDEFGDVRIMDYGSGSKTRYRVASFCPGYESSYPGDSPKMNPERDQWCHTLAEATDFFTIYVGSAKCIYGWAPVTPTGRIEGERVFI